MGMMAMTARSQARIGIRGGLNLANVTTDKDGNTDNSHLLPSFNAGVFADLPLADELALQPGILLNGKGSKVNIRSGALNTDMDIRMNPLYLEVPVNFVGKIPISADGDTRLLLGAGPYAAFGIGGNVRTKGTFLGGDVDEKSSIEWDDDTPFSNDDRNQGWNKLKRFDYGANLMAGFQFDNVGITANYGLGLANIHSGSDNDNSEWKSRNRVWSISLNYLFDD
ncbi:hypothetical protein GCM10023143_29350 [Compostibacter hankyongensis]|uniref:Outer membrane protein beta-barrel domain-containing protein n=2 Tax=Compostibacter hankyongensis TaxID=1007089 RepID=A0ABP8G5D5_9BACT